MSASQLLRRGMDTVKASNPFAKFWGVLAGSRPNPFKSNAMHGMALIALMAWVGLGADGLSSACYGPQEAFLALGHHPQLAFYVAIATAATVFIIALGYNQVVDLFPSGGGGYKVASTLLGSYAGLVSGAALLVDYILTIAISVASGTDALFSLLPLSMAHYKAMTQLALVILLTLLNLRGMKESIAVLLPIFIGFVVLHFGLISYGILSHESGLPKIINSANHDTLHMTSLFGWFAVLGFILHSYSMGSGTYTGLESVSNNVNRLAKPRKRTAKFTMLYMAISLSFLAAGILILYLLWNVHPEAGKTLNAVVFQKILGHSETGHMALILTLSLEAGILFVAANTGFLAGPVVLANMAVDNWVPKRFRYFSSRLVTQNGIIAFGLAAFIILLITQGSMALLIVLYSINVFITFSLTLLSLCTYWCRHRSRASKQWISKLSICLLGFIITAGILIVTIIEKFMDGALDTLLITGAVILGCILVKRHYNKMSRKLDSITGDLTPIVEPIDHNPGGLDPEQPTAVFFIGENIAVGMHTLLWALRMFPNHFKNILFVSAGIVDMESFRGEESLNAMKKQVRQRLNYFVNYCRQHGFAADSFEAYGTDPIKHLSHKAKRISKEYPNSIFFASRWIFERDNWLMRMLHNETPVALQRKLHSLGKQLVILPMKI